MSVSENLKSINASIPEGVTLIAVSKLKPASDIVEAYQAGHRHFGENRVAEFEEKAAQLPEDIQWHFIGHLQSKKVKKVVPHANLIHSVDSIKLLEEIDKRAGNINKTMDCLLQLHIAREETKYGFSEDELVQFISSGGLDQLKHVRVVGVMGMATFTEDSEQVRSEFKQLKEVFSRLKEQFALPEYFKEVSMGMSNDYPIAIEEGSTMIRVGSAIFGARH